MTQLYDVLHCYWRGEFHVIGVTDDLAYARTMLLEDARRSVGESRVLAGLAKLESELRLLDTCRNCYVSFGDNRYQIRYSQLRVAIGGMSTLPETDRSTP